MENLSEWAESTIHPKNVKIGDILNLLYKGEEIEVKVLYEPFEVETIDEDNKGWWQCGIRRLERGYDDWYIVWSEDNPVWEVGAE